MYRIYYGDGSTYAGLPETAPVFGVQAIVQQDKDVGWIISAERDFYVWRDERWWGVDVFGLVQYLHAPGWKRVLLGELITIDRWREINAHALQDREFAQKHTYLPERRDRRPIE